MASFHPSSALSFDLRRGRIRMAGSASQLLIPVDAMLTVLRALGSEEVGDFGRMVGTELGRRVVAAFAHGEGALAEASPEAVLDCLGGAFAVQGFGSLGLERWGAALVLVIDDSPLGPDGREFLGAVLEGALQRGFGRAARAVELDFDGARTRYALLGETTAGDVRAALRAGSPWTTVVGQLGATGGEA